MKPRQLQLPRSGPDGQPIESSHLAVHLGLHFGIAYAVAATFAGLCFALTLWMPDIRLRGMPHAAPTPE
jgi:hypothetical protein